MFSEISCKFRHSVRKLDGQEKATCGLLQKLLATDSDDLTDACEVKRDACAACSQSMPVTSDLVGGAFASILNNACEKALLHESGQVKELRTLAEAAEEAILESEFPRCLSTCDVILWCNRLSPGIHRTIESVVSQQNAATIVHLAIPLTSHQCVEFDIGELIASYETRYDVRIHWLSQATCPMRALHELAPLLNSEFIALQHDQAFSLPNRINSAVTELRRLGADFIGSPLRSPAGEVEVPDEPGTRFEPSLPWPTLVFRRATFIDLGGVAERNGDSDVELLYRARKCGAKIAVLPWATVELEQDWQPPSCGEVPDYSMQSGTLRHHALGYPKTHVSCDIVLPVFGQLDFVRPAIESVIDQNDASAIVHLVDDCGPEDVTDLFRYWRTHPRIRLYRNTRNIGQYTSFNNVSEYFESDLAAVQDGDDLSLPDRLCLSGNLLELSGSDYFAAAMEQFGASGGLPSRRSNYPSRMDSPYFAMNPTACFRVSMFRSLGGYTDFGAHERNRGGLDSEFMNRAYLSQRRFALSTSMVTRRRIHSEAATQRADTGFGSRLRNQALQETRRRIVLMKAARVDPRHFGGLGFHRHLTERLS